MFRYLAANHKHSGETRLILLFKIWVNICILFLTTTCTASETVKDSVILSIGGALSYRSQPYNLAANSFGPVFGIGAAYNIRNLVRIGGIGEYSALGGTPTNESYQTYFAGITGSTRIARLSESNIFFDFRIGLAETKLGNLHDYSAAYGVGTSYELEITPSVSLIGRLVFRYTPTGLLYRAFQTFDPGLILSFSI